MPYKKFSTPTALFAGFLTLAILICALYVAKSLVLPIIFAAFISLLCGPAINALVKLGIPRVINVIVVLSLMMGVIFLALSMLTEPAQQWWSKLPDLVKNVSQEISKVTSDASKEQGSILEMAEDISLGEMQTNTALSLTKSVITETPTIFSQLFIALFMAYFMLNYGRTLFRQSLKLLSNFSIKRKAVELVQAIQQDLSRYLATITIVNIGLGIAVGFALLALGVEDPFLWGIFAGLLNFAPYLGPMISMVCLGLVGFIQFDSSSYAFIIMGTFIVINMIESQFVTPTSLGKRFNLNPLIIFIWLVIWGWLWGAMGMFIGVPLLVCLNIILERLSMFGNFYQVLRTPETKKE